MRISRLAALVANASFEDRVEFFRQCSLPTEKELNKVFELLTTRATKKVALYKELPLGEDLNPTDEAAVRFSQLHPTYSWYALEEIDEAVYNSLPEEKRDNYIDYWGDIDPDDPALVALVEELGHTGVLSCGEYEIVEVPEGADLTYREDVVQLDEYDWRRYMYVRSACILWVPNY